jgi:hypothetical protein
MDIRELLWKSVLVSKLVMLEPVRSVLSTVDWTNIALTGCHWRHRHVVTSDSLLQLVNPVLLLALMQWPSQLYEV